MKQMPAMTTDRELLARADALVREAKIVLAELSLFERLSGVGRPVPIGSSASNVMVLPDIDVGVLCVSLNSARIISTMQPLFDHPKIKRLNFIDERGRMQSMPGLENEGLYCGVRYLEDGTLHGKEWKIDVWFFPQDAPRPEIGLRERLLAASGAKRLAILRIKDELIHRDRYGHDVHGIDVYAAVLDSHSRTIRDFNAIHPL